MTDQDDEKHHHKHHNHASANSQPGGGSGGGGPIGGGGGPHGGSAHWSVTGLVLHPNGTPASGTPIALVRKRLRHETPLGHATSGADGTYAIHYPAPNDGASVDLVARIVPRDYSTAIDSPILFDAGPVETINLSLTGVFREPSAWTSLVARLKPELDDIRLADLEQSKERQDISFLSLSLAHDPKDIAGLVIAEKLQAKTSVTAQNFYALFRAGIPTSLGAALDAMDTVVIDDVFLTRVLNGVLGLPIERIDSTVRAAVSMNTVPATLLADLPVELAKLKTLRVQYVGGAPYGQSKTPLATLLATSGATSDLQAKFLASYTQAQGNLNAVWKELAADPTVTQPAIATLRFGLNAADLLKGNLPLLQHWVAARSAGQVKDLPDLARMDANDWINLLGQVDPGATSIPPVVPNETAEAKIERFAAVIAGRFGTEMPTPSLAGQMMKDPNAPVTSRADVLAFLANSPTFDFGSTHVDRFVKDNADKAFVGVGDPEQTVKDLKRVQRVFKLSPTYPAVNALLADKIDSAQAIYFLGKQRFVQRYADSTALGPTQAAAVYDRAEGAYATALALFGKFNAAMRFGSPSAIAPPVDSTNDPNTQLDGFPDLQSLFGSRDYCVCEDCRSVLSPAAYLVDLLQFLAGRAAKDPPPVPPPANVQLKGAQYPFFARRPDVFDVELSCDNTNLVLPYIDLVCETLEDAVVSSTTPPRQRQTSGSAEDLRATPAYVNADAYNKLAGQAPPPAPANRFPFSMPFNLWVEQSRAFLGALGLKRADVMKLYQAAAAGGTPDDTTIAAESLGISPAERIILNPSSIPVWDFWGLGELNNDVINPSLPDNASADLHGTWLDVLKYVPVFLQRTALDFRGLAQLLDVRFINPGPTVRIADPDNPDHPTFASCDTGNMQLSGLAEAWLDRAHRFLRLWRKTGRTMWELDKIVLSPGVGGGQIGDRLLLSLAMLTALEGRLGLPADELLAFWSDLDTAAPYVNRLGDSEVVVPSVYDRNFRNPALVGLGAVFPANPQAMTGHLSDPTVTTAIGAVLNLTSDGIAAIVAAAALPDTLNLSTLSVVFRYARLASALAVTVPDFVLWMALTAVDAHGLPVLAPDTHPFVDPPQTVEFLRRFEVLAATQLAAADVDYLLRHGSTARSGFVLPEDAIAADLAALRTGLQKVADRVSQAGGSDRECIRSLLATIPEFKDHALIDTALQIVDGTFATGQPDQDTFIDQHFSAFMDASKAKARLDQAIAPPPDVDDRLAFVLGAIARYFSISFVTQTVSSQLTLSAQTAALLLVQGTLAGSTTPLGDVLDDARILERATAGGAYAFDLTRANFPDAYAAYTLLSKIARLLAVTKVTPKELSWLLANAPALGWLIPTGLPTAPGHPVSYGAFARLLLGTNLQHRMRAGTVAFFDHVLVATAVGVTLSDALGSAASLLGWDVASVTSLATAFGLTDPSQLADVYVVDRLGRAVATAKNLGIGATLALGLANPEPTAADADAVRQILKSKFDAGTWRQVLIPIEDALREKKRDALVSYLLAHPDPSADRRWQTADDLYGWFLFDTQMEACQLSTRILLATAAVQHFVQRCFMNLEPDVVVSTDLAVDPNADDGWLQWDWMKYFRVWQANREVFLWPENYLVPELRPDQSPFFRDLSKELLQSDLTSDTAEDAFHHYLEKLADVQRLVVCAHYHEVDGGHDTLHVVGRTRATSPNYYYRRRVDSSYWTAWEKIDLDISGEHVLIVVWDRRLHLVWPIFSQQAMPVSDQKITVPTTSGKPTMPTYYWDIQLAISEKKHDKWTAKRVFEQKFVGTLFGVKAGYHFKASVASDDELVVDVFDAFFGAVQQHVGEFVVNAATGEVAVYGSESPYSASFGVGADLIGSLQQTGRMLPDLPSPQGLFPYDQRLVFDPAQGDPLLAPVSLNVLANSPAINVEIVGQILRPALAIAQQDLFFDSLTPFFIEDPARSFFVEPAFFAPGSYGGPIVPHPGSYHPNAWVTAFTLSTFYHPYVTTMIRELNRVGIPALLTRNLQLHPDVVRGNPPLDFASEYKPQLPVWTPYPSEDIDFTPGGAYSLYNWELFFDAPFLIALRLLKNRRFADAMKWLNYVFDPTDSSKDPLPPQRYWRTRPFYETTGSDYQQQEITELLQLVAQGDPELKTLIDQWRDDPFDPWMIAKHRTVALQRAVVMKFIDNLIAWGDSLLREDAMETIAEATQLYVMASQLLGARPQVVRMNEASDARTYNDLQALGIDDFGNAIVDVENLLPAVGMAIPHGPAPGPQLPRLPTLYFCVPPNAQLLAYWDTVADRLFKIRHCMNIEGLVRQLPLYAPPINPMLLVQAAAAGIDLASVLSDQNAPLPSYRFSTMFGKALALCGEVQSLGGALLAAIEKNDAETMAALRAGQEVALLTKLRDVKFDQHEAAKADRLVLDNTQAITQTRLTHYSNLLSAGLNDGEAIARDIEAGIVVVEGLATIVFTLAALGAWVPDFWMGAAGLGGSPAAVIVSGGQQVVNAGHLAGLALQHGVEAARTGAQLASTLAGYARRAEDWELQQALAQGELAQITQQKIAAEIRTAVAQADLDAHDVQTSNSQAVSDFLQNKFSNADLYDWMSSQLANVYFQAYQLAYDLAKRAERAFNYELGTDESFVTFGYWDSLHKGLLAGESLMFDLRRMEASYCDLNKREYEITKHVSLAILAPEQLIKLRETGSCTFQLTEPLFDDDYPGHYFRRIKTVSLTVPCVVGPYTGVNATLTLSSSSVRTSTVLTPQYQRLPPPPAPPLPDKRFTDYLGAVQGIATSTAQNDAGLFEVSFQDERYLPFERQGAIGTWQLELLPETNQFDVSTITDVILHLRYTARDGGQGVKEEVKKILLNATRTGAVFVSMKQQFSDAFFRFLNPTGTGQTLSFGLGEELFPFIARGKTLTATQIDLYLKLRDPKAAANYATGTALKVSVGPDVAPPPDTLVTLTSDPSLGGAPHGAPLTGSFAVPSNWHIAVQEKDIAGTTLDLSVASGGATHDRIDPEQVDDVILLIQFKATAT